MIERWVLFSILMLAARRVCVRYWEKVLPVSDLNNVERYDVLTCIFSAVDARVISLL